ncbi:B3 domain-containing transcription factor FUS3-like isoform X2 [Cynara cardunculus var. scolymus]|uniref:B3 domain-containing transcription factor FUS3-like isoform X2 n=1 Tax=Cynara cardunculus var. scolymus TaxID=59895 RepID=UPI000D62F6B5|nr:B3 domain-containing transcription factor FUS3-like isoform X2 [Cynara cardunculus var. scolymus]
MERNEACALRAFAGFDIGLGINFGGVQDNTYKTKKPAAAAAAAATATATDRDLVAAARFDFLKKKRMPRFRRGASAALRSFRPFTTPLSSTVSSSSFVGPIVDQGRLTFLFSKKLQKSDVGVLKRIVLPKKPAETHLPALIAKEGIILEMDDMDGMHVWCFKFRFWPNNNSRMYVLEGTGEFAEEHELQLGDYIMLYRDSVNLNYVIQAVKAYEVEEYAKKEVKANLGSQGKSGKPQPNNGVLMNQNWPWGGLEVEVLNPTNYPMNASTVEDQMGMTFIYDTSYSNDTLTPLDFLGGFMTSYPTVQPNFAIENLSIDDLYKI